MHGYTSTFFCVNFLGTSIFVVFADIQDFLLLRYITLWYTFLLYFCLCFCVYIEIVSLVWNSYANNVAGENSEIHI
jgi:hypothetical protein